MLASNQVQALLKAPPDLVTAAEKQNAILMSALQMPKGGH